MTGLIDSHCHLNYKSLVDEVDAALDRARARDIRGFLTINTCLSQFDEIHTIAQGQPDVWCTVGVHPHQAEQEQHVTQADLEARADLSKCVGLGESGLDYFYDKSPRDIQARNFRHHLAAAQSTGLPLVVHTRDAEADTHAMMAEALKAAPYQAVIHCFSGTADFADQMVDLGFYVSFSGIVTFKKSDEVREAARRVPLDRLLVETDSPFLAPVPHRGKRCEPAYVADTAAVVAKVKGLSLDALAQATTDNFFRLFSKAQRPEALA